MKCISLTYRIVRIVKILPGQTYDCGVNNENFLLGKKKTAAKHVQ